MSSRSRGGRGSIGGSGGDGDKSSTSSVPLIPLTLVDAPTQRLWTASFVILVQSYKLFYLTTYALGGGNSRFAAAVLGDTTSSATRAAGGTAALLHPLLPYAILLDLFLVLLLAKLNVPRFSFARATWFVVAAAVVACDWFALGGWRSLLAWIVYLPGLGAVTQSVVWLSDSLNPWAGQLSIGGGRVRVRKLISPTERIVGQHTIHILPYSTATLTPLGSSASVCHCIGPQTSHGTIYLPVLFNNTEPRLIQYSVTPFGIPREQEMQHRELFNVTVTKGALSYVGDLMEAFADEVGDELDLELDDAERDAGAGAAVSRQLVRKGASEERQAASRRASSGNAGAKGADRRRITRKTGGVGQKLFQLPISSVGRVRLERVLDAKNLDARIERSEVLIVECPSTTFIDAAHDDPSAAAAGQVVKAARKVIKKASSAASRLPTQHQCPGDEVSLAVRVRGLAPLELSYSRVWTPPSSASGNKKRNAQQTQQQLSSSSSSAKGLRNGVAEMQRISHISSSHAVSPLDGPDRAAAGAATGERLAAALGRARSTGQVGDYAWAQARDVVMPITLDLREVGTYRYALESVSDACGNALDVAGLAEQGGAAALAGVTQQREVVVHGRAHVAFESCSVEKPIGLLRGSTGKTIALRAHGFVAEQDGEWQATVHYEPDTSSEGHRASSWTRNVTLASSSGVARIQAEAPGTYSIEGVQGAYCAGEVGAPWTCAVVDLPPPTADITFKEIHDKCGGPVGVSALAVLSGTPPFKLAYQEIRQGRSERTLERRVERTREEIEFMPSVDGEVVIRFVGLEDANYKKIKLQGYEFKQSLHPLARAKFVSGGVAGQQSPRVRQQEQRYADEGAQAVLPTLVMYGCEGNKASANIELSGVGPFALTYSVLMDTGRTGQRTTTQHRLQGLQGPTHKLDIDLPADLLENGGTLTLSLVSIQDAKGCERPLATSDLNVEVRRTKPSVGFVVPVGKPRGEVYILEGGRAKLPLRLAGEGPWKVSVAHAGAGKGAVSTVYALREAETEITVDTPGTYTISEIHDQHCPGQVLSGRGEFSVLQRARPHVAFEDAAGVRSSVNSSLLRAPVCVGKADAVDVVLQGHFPLQVAFEHSAPAWSASDAAAAAAVAGVGPNAVLEDLPASNPGAGGAAKRSRHTFSSAQPVTSFQLSTLVPGWHAYTLTGVGDTIYAPANLPRSAERVRLEQMVHSLPSAAFQHAGHKARRPSFCVGDALAPRSDGKTSTTLPPLTLTGSAPFAIDFTVRDASGLTAPQTFHRTGITTSTYTFQLDAEVFTFDRVGRWIVSVDRIVDNNGCEAVLAAGRAAGVETEIEVDVAETASIAPVGTSADYCVGESVEFVLQGTAPWSVQYTFNGKASRTRTDKSAFSRVADRAGELRIVSVAHESNRCGRKVEGEEGMVKTIHDLPSVVVKEGNHYVQDLREGTQAEIAFHLRGVPPFSFTFQRTEPADRYPNPKVLETRTVAGIQGHEWSTFTSQEGTWSVTWLQDKHCSVSLVSGATGRSQAGPQKMIEL